MKLKSFYQQIYPISWNEPKALKIEATSGTSYTITYNHKTNEIKCDVSEGGSTDSGSEGSGGSTTDDTWAETEIVLRDVFIPRDIISLVTSSALVVRK